ncbi:WHG domain-containing protein [Dactylosporangium sp. NPDC005572]|uniref:TetR/AcrR family transcriptional regulator n=1 Tax=Dactylosporangium sp. NPDC005572 TaxID=3156889 RepID=UPI0033BC0168
MVISPRKGLTTEIVVKAAADLADEVGLPALTVSAVARRLGVKDASLYSHVKSLDDLRTRIALLAAEEMTDRIAFAVVGRSGKDALVAFADMYRAFAVERPGRYAATQRPLDPAVTEGTAAMIRSLELTHGMLRGYGLVDPDLTDAARLLRSAFHGFAVLESNGGFAHPRSLDGSWRRALDALHHTLVHWADHAPGSGE